MAKFSGSVTRPAVRSAVKTVSSTPDILTFEGAKAFTRDARSELFVTALTSMVKEDSFYESAATKDTRLVNLARQVAQTDPEWMTKFVPWLRREGFMRSAPIVLAAEYIAAGAPGGRALVASTLSRADEPAEILAYWMQKYGRAIPQPLKRGVADAVVRLYTEKNVLKYDGSGRAWRFGDVIELVHPTPADQAQSDLFKFCLDRRRHGESVNLESLPLLGRVLALEVIPAERRRTVLENGLPDGMTWERLSGWLPGGMDGQAWDAMIPGMGYMALLRNLRNFDQAGISDVSRQLVAAILSDPDEVARSMQFPFRFYSAYRQDIDAYWVPILESALELSVQNIPVLTGTSLVIIDVSGSMDWGYSSKGTMTYKVAASLFGHSLYHANPEGTRLIAAASDWAELSGSRSVLRGVRNTEDANLGGGTELGAAVRATYQGEDRVFIFTDGQFWDQLPELDVPYYLFNLNAHASTPVAAGQGKDHEIGGLSDATFKLIPLLEQHRHGVWPWELPTPVAPIF